MKKLAALLLGTLLMPVMAFGQMNTFQGGTGTTSPFGILYGDSSIRLKTVKIGSNLTFSAGTLSATDNTASSTLLTDNNTFSGVNLFTNALSNFSGTWQTFAPSHFQTALSGTPGQYLIFANGAWTGAATSTYSSPLVFNVNTNAVSCPTCGTGSGSVTSITAGTGLNGGTITTAGTLAMVSYLATSTADVGGQVMYWNTTNGTPAKISSVATSTETRSVAFSSTGTVGSNVGGTSGTLSSVMQPSFTYATSTAWTGTTTIALQTNNQLAETLNGFSCNTATGGGTGGTLNIQFGTGAASTTMVNASSTANFNANTLSIGANSKLLVTIGTPATTPTAIVCTTKLTI